MWWSLFIIISFRCLTQTLCSIDSKYITKVLLYNFMLLKNFSYLSSPSILYVLAKYCLQFFLQLQKKDSKSIDLLHNYHLTVALFKSWTYSPFEEKKCLQPRMKLHNYIQRSFSRARTTDAWGLDYKFNHNPNPNRYPFKMSKKLVFL